MIKKTRKSYYGRKDLVPTPSKKVNMKKTIQTGPKINQSSLNSVKKAVVFEDLDVDFSKEIMDFIR